jgi:hypothetical protein
MLRDLQETLFWELLVYWSVILALSKMGIESKNKVKNIHVDEEGAEEVQLSCG